MNALSAVFVWIFAALILVVCAALMVWWVAKMVTHVGGPLANWGRGVRGRR